MNLTLGFPNPEPDDPLGLARRTGLQASIEKLNAWMLEPESPIRAIRIQPACEGEYAEVPMEVPAVLRDVLAGRGIERLYVHQAESFDALAAGQERRRGHADGQREDAVL